MDGFEANVGARLRALRESYGLSREKLSEMADITPKFLYEIESGRKGMSAYTLYNISKALNVSCDYLLVGRTTGNIEHITNILLTLTDEELLNVAQIVRCAAALAHGKSEK